MVIVRLFRVTAVICVLLSFATAIHAQYPQLTQEAVHYADSIGNIAKHHRDSAWAVALPIVIKEAKEGRPYVPWASRPYDLRQAKIPAFPGAEGGGMYTFGGRGGKVLTVTNLNDSGPGSFRWACEQGGARIVVFNVSGIIHLKSSINVRAPYITIAGQTAPGEGICIAGESFCIDTHDVIVRHMRFRRGNTSVMSRDDAFGGNPIGNIMIDHCSCEWGLDENISFYRHMFSLGKDKERIKTPTVNVTIQNTISAKALDNWNHSFGSTIGGENTTFMRNLWASNTGRNPSIGWGGVFNFINNIVFNWENRTADGGDYATMGNFINNYYKPGPVTPKDKPIAFRIVAPESRSAQMLPYRQFGRIYATGNIMEGFPEVTADNWKGGIQLIDKDGTPGTPEEMELMKMREPFEMAPLTIIPSDQVFSHVLANVGATLPCRDIVDQRICEEVRTGIAYYVPDYEKNFAKAQKKSKKKDSKKKNSKKKYRVVDGSPVNTALSSIAGDCQSPKAPTPYGDVWGLAPQSQNEQGYFRYRRLPQDSYKLGIITHPQQMGGYPVYKAWQPYLDTDLDGMPDQWERRYGLNPNDPTDANGDINGDGYTNIEKYINGIDPATKTDWRNLDNNHDTLTKPLNNQH